MKFLMFLVTITNLISVERPHRVVRRDDDHNVLLKIQKIKG